MSREIKTVQGRAVPVRGNDIDTDRIIPARFLRCVSFDGLGEHAFEDDRTDAKHAFNQPAYQGASILITNKNFGCGSSREHAPQSLVRWGTPTHPGIKGLIGESFAEIFFGNCTTLGVPCMVVTQDVAEALLAAVEANPALSITMDIEHQTIIAGDTRYPGTIPNGPRTQLVDGSWDALGELLDGADAVRRVDAALSY